MDYTRLTIETLKTALYEQVVTESFNEETVKEAILQLKIGFDTAVVNPIAVKESTTELEQFARDLEFVLYDAN
jgi:hypothetical protein